MADSVARPMTAPPAGDGRVWYDVDDILAAMSVKAGSICVDLGCGAGEFTFTLARSIGASGRVYAVDSSVAALDQLKIKKPGANIVTLRAELADTRLPAGQADLVLMAFSLSTVADAGSVLAEAARLLKPDGRIAVVEWRTVPPPPGPSMARRIRNDRMQRLLESHGFTAVQRQREGAVYYSFSARKGKAGPPVTRPPAPARR